MARELTSGLEPMSEECSQVIVVAGLNGAGKTTELYQPLADAWSVYDNSVSSEPVSIASGGVRRPLMVFETDSWTNFSKSKQ